LTAGSGLELVDRGELRDEPDRFIAVNIQGGPKIHH